MYCQYCGKSIPDNSQQCPYCGAPLHRTRRNEKDNTPLVIIVCAIFIALVLIALVYFFYTEKDGDRNVVQENELVTETANDNAAVSDE